MDPTVVERKENPLERGEDQEVVSAVVQPTAATSFAAPVEITDSCQLESEAAFALTTVGVEEAPIRDSKIETSLRLLVTGDEEPLERGLTHDDELTAKQDSRNKYGYHLLRPPHIDESDRAQSNAQSTTSTLTNNNDEELGGIRLRRRLMRRNTFTDEEMKNIPRLIHRNLPFKQSRQEVAVENKTSFRSFKVQRILSQDWYHVLLRQPAWYSILCLLLIWTLFIVLFATIYQKIDRDNPSVECGLGPKNQPIEFKPALAFSLETCTTVGYGLPNGVNGFFESECGGLQIAIFFQMTLSMLFNAFLFAFLFARLSRSDARGAQVLFSDKAIIEVRDGKWMMHVRIYDFDSSKCVVEAHTRMYCVSWRDYERQERDLVQPHLLQPMRILRPNDELGAQLFTSIPTNITHEIDAYSPLAPLKLRRKVNYLRTAGLYLREADQINGSRNGVLCPVCGETYGTLDSLKRHVQYQQLAEEKDNFPVSGSHRDTSIMKPSLFEPFMLTEDDIREYLRDKEIMVVVEGIEPMVSGTFQALQSYKLNDIVFGGRFAPCMSQANGKIYVDVDQFHIILPPNDGSVHLYSRYNGGYAYRRKKTSSYLPAFFRNSNENEGEGNYNKKKQSK